MSKNECQELKNIKYKTMLLSNNLDLNPNIKDDINNIDIFLERESILNKSEPWNKLDKTIKIKKLNEFVNTLTKEHKLNLLESKNIKNQLTDALDKKQLMKVKDIQYDKENGIIKNIPNLHFNSTTRKFTLNKSEKHISASKSLAPKNNNTKKHIKESSDKDKEREKEKEKKDKKDKKDKKQANKDKIE